MALGVVEGAKYLTKHSLVEAAIEHATENGAFDMAFELAQQNMPKKLGDIHLKHALFLEDDERFKEAEDEFIKANKPKEAIEMYVHQQDWVSAIRVAENYEPAAVPDVYIAQARVKAEAADYSAAEELYISAARPELALVMYQEADMWTEALKLAQMHLPHRVGEVSASCQSAQARQGKGALKGDYMSNGRALEQSKQWAQAIDVYLGARKERVDSVQDLEDIWSRAIEVARNHLPNRQVEVSLEVSKRLVEAKREESAADVLFEIGRHDEAVAVCIAAKKYDKAKALAQGNATLRRKVEDAYQGHLVVNEDHSELVELGRTDVALDVLAKRGDWDRLWEVAAKEKMATSTIAKFIIMRVEELVRSGGTKVDEAVSLLTKKQGPSTEAALNTYRRLTTSLLSRKNDEEGPDHIASVASLRDILYRLANLYKNSVTVNDKQLGPEIDDLLMATHYQHMLYAAQALGLKDLTARCAVTLLKYPDTVPQDKAFYQAGAMCKEQGNTNLAFMLLNR
jgi:intraflagellar transport protein 172